MGRPPGCNPCCPTPTNPSGPCGNIAPCTLCPNYSQYDTFFVWYSTGDWTFDGQTATRLSGHDTFCNGAVAPIADVHWILQNDCQNPSIGANPSGCRWSWKSPDIPGIIWTEIVLEATTVSPSPLGGTGSLPVWLITLSAFGGTLKYFQPQQATGGYSAWDCSAYQYNLQPAASPHFMTLWPQGSSLSGITLCQNMIHLGNTYLLRSDTVCPVCPTKWTLSNNFPNPITATMTQGWNINTQWQVQIQPGNCDNSTLGGVFNLPIVMNSWCQFRLDVAGQNGSFWNTIQLMAAVGPEYTLTLTGINGDQAIYTGAGTCQGPVTLTRTQDLSHCPGVLPATITISIT